jgi:2-haloacid dehalogenase
MKNNNINSPKYKLILFDADGTLFDYDVAEGVALRKTFEKYCFIYSEDIRNMYRGINSSLWKEFENGKIDKVNLQTGRFERLLNECNYKADANELNQFYLDILAESGHLIDGALEICNELSKFCTLAIATNGIARTQKGRLKNSLI